MQQLRLAPEMVLLVQNKEAVRGKFWLTDTDLKRSLILKADKTGKAIMTILRHVGRVSEVSCSRCIPFVVQLEKTGYCSCQYP